MSCPVYCEANPYETVDHFYRLLSQVSFEYNGYTSAYNLLVPRDPCNTPFWWSRKARDEARPRVVLKPLAAPAIRTFDLSAFSRKAGLTCLECGEGSPRFNNLAAHLRHDHGISPDVYRMKWNLPPETPMVSIAHRKAKACFMRLVRLGGLCPDCETRKTCCTDSLAMIGIEPAGL